MASTLAAGQIYFTAGFCTHAFLLRGKSLSELDYMLGFRSGRLAAGAALLFLEQSPDADDLELAGYTQFSDGAIQGHKVAPQDRAPRRMEALLKSEDGWSDAQIRLYKQKMIGSKIVIAGPDRLAKLVPNTPEALHEDYPPGTGVFQVRIRRRLLFRVKAAIPPNTKWLGDYR
jgi:hypothetical protein